MGSCNCNMATTTPHPPYPLPHPYCALSSSLPFKSFSEMLHNHPKRCLPYSDSLDSFNSLDTRLPPLRFLRFPTPPTPIPSIPSIPPRFPTPSPLLPLQSAGIKASAMAFSTNQPVARVVVVDVARNCYRFALIRFYIRSINVALFLHFQFLYNSQINVIALFLK